MIYKNDMRLKRKIGAFLVLGVFAFLMLVQPAAAVDITMGDTEWIGLGAAKGRIVFDDEATDEIEMLDAVVGIGDTSPDFKLEVTGSSGSGYFGVSSSDDEGDNGDIFKIDSNGNVGIGVASPLCKFHVDGGALLVTGSTGSTPVSGAGTRMMWIPGKAAFRAGEVTGLGWNEAYIGDRSTAMGYDTVAAGEGSIAMGLETAALESGSTAMGMFSQASGAASTAMGYGTIADGEFSTAMGQETATYGPCSTAMGSGTEAWGDASTAIGTETIAMGDTSTAIGLYTTAFGLGSIAMGQYVTAGLEEEVFNNIVIGSGVDDNNRLVNDVENSLMVGFNSDIPTLFIGPSEGEGETGDVGIGMATPSHKLEISDSDTTANRAGLYVTQSGTQSGNTGYGIKVIKTGASDYNIAGYFSASGGTNDYGLIVEDGYVGIGDEYPDGIFEVCKEGILDAHSLYVDASSGNVGLGTNDPDTILELNSLGGGTPAITFDRSGDEYTMGSYFDDFRIGTTSLTTNVRFTIDQDGRVGIGTTSPDTDAKLHLREDTGDNAIAFSAGDDSADYILGLDASDSSKFKIHSGSALIDDSDFTLDTNGYVGLGTGDPSERLGVNGDVIIGSTESWYEGTTSGDLAVEGQVGIGKRTSINAKLEVQDTGYQLRLTYSGAVSTILQTRSDGDLYISPSGGNVGIGTNDPKGALDVTSTTGGFIVPRMTNTQQSSITAVNGMIIYDITYNQFEFYENGAWVTK